MSFLTFDAVVASGHLDTPETARALVAVGAFPREQSREQWGELDDGLVNAALV